MDSALIISYSEKNNQDLHKILSEAAISEITVIPTASEARRVLIEKDFDLIIVNTPLPDEFGESLARHIAEKKISEVILLVKAEMFDEISHKVEEYGIITIAKPIGKALFWNALKIASAAHKRVKIIQNENKKLVQKIEDIRIIDRAKCILISQLSFSEPEAHRYIEKQAMDLRVTRRKIAEEILKMYES
ncbi:MAG TPA: ANTAR domain-containing protein [Mobilitalea sp.]|nr:ANTAR domain-containing protein [Mobilitalea sp.]